MMSDERRIRLTKMKLVSQARQYWTNVEKLMKLRNQGPIQTWDEMKMKFQKQYLPVIHTMPDQLQRLTQGNRSVLEYIKNFDQFLVRCGENGSDAVVLFRFRSELKENLRHELFAKDVSTLK